MQVYIITRLGPVQIIAMSLFRESSIRARLYNYWVGVAKLSVEQGFLVLRLYNWGWITVRYTELRGVRCSGVSNVLKSMEKRSGR